MKKLDRFSRGMGIGGWLTNYKRFNVLPDEWRFEITKGDMEHFQSYITEEDIKNIKNMGMDHVRLGFDQIVVEKSPFVYRKEIFEILHNFVGWCKKYNLRLVLNMHKALGNYCDIHEECGLFESCELMNRFVALWVEFEKEFSDETDVMFELLNEVLDLEPHFWNNLAERTIKEIRKYNKSRIIIVGTTCWNSPDKLKDLQVYDDENIIYTFHNYAPNEFTHQQGVLQPHQLYYNRKLAWPCDDIERYREYHRLVGNKEAYEDITRMDINFLYSALAGAKEFIEKYPDKILWCGEFGTIRHCNIIYRENWMRDMIKILKEWDIPYCVWNYLSMPNDGNRFSLVDDDTRKILSDNMLHIIRGEVK